VGHHQKELDRLWDKPLQLFGKLPNVGEEALLAMLEVQVDVAEILGRDAEDRVNKYQWVVGVVPVV
jgi:hypothetical protein